MTTKRKRSDAPDYDEKYREQQAEISRENSAKRRDIGDIPAIVDQARRERCRNSLLEFCTTYFPSRFDSSFSVNHITAVQRFEQITLQGGRFALAMPRASGKTTIAECAAMHALLYGRRKYVIFVAATEDLANDSLKAIKEELDSNDLLNEDFPEACYPIRCLEQIATRANGQTYGGGKPTRMQWTASRVTLPLIDGSECAGAGIRVVGITGAIRGRNISIRGKKVRPDLVIIDDAQDRDSAKSPAQTNDKEMIVKGDILGLAGPKTQIAAAMLCTVIYKNDLSERFLSHEKNPQWRGQRTKLLEKFPENMAKWDEYDEVRRGSFSGHADDENAVANAFFLANQAELERGAVVPWADRKMPGTVSALQSAMNLYYDDKRVFMAEYQNEPFDGDEGHGGKELHPDAIAGRFIGSERYQLPPDTTRLTCFIDVGKKVLWYAVTAWNEQFGGTIVDYGPYPKQNRSFFAADDARPTLSDAFPHLKKDAELVFAGLAALTSDVLGRTYYYANGQTRNVERCLIDSGWETDAVKQFVRRSEYRAILSPSKGIARTTSAKGIHEWAAKPGERKGHHWRLSVQDKLLQFDPDAWKSILHGMLLVHAGGKGGLWLYGTSANAHEMLAHHLSAEYSQSVTIRGSTFDKWEVKPDRPDNHLLDCVVGATVAASVTGLQFSASGTPEVAEKKRRKTFAELEAEAQAQARPR